MAEVYPAPAGLPKVNATDGHLAPAPDLAAHALKGVGGGASGGGSATKEKRDEKKKKSEDNELISDTAQIRSTYTPQLNETMTIHAAISHYQGQSEAVALSAAQLMEFKSLLNRHRPHAAREYAPTGNAYVIGGLGESTWFSANSDYNDDALMREFQDESPAPQVLMPAVRRPFVNLPPDYAPQSAAQEELLFLLTTDPRAGFAPEGIAAYLAWVKHGLELERPHNAFADFCDSNSKQSWNVAPIRELAPRPIAEIQAAVTIADSNHAFLLVDAAHLEHLDGALGKAVRELAVTASDTRILVVLGPTEQVTSST